MADLKPEFRKMEAHSKDGWFSDGLIAVGIVLGIAATLLAVLWLEYSDVSMADLDLASLIPASVAVMIAGTSLFVAFFALREQK